MYTNLAPIAPQHATSCPTDLSLKDKAFQGIASVNDSNGNTMFRIQSKRLSISQRRWLLDSEGNVIAQLRWQKMGLIPTIYIGTHENEKKVTVKTENMLSILKCNALITIDGKKVGKVEGDWSLKKFTITIDGVEVATIGRKRTAATTFAGGETYTIGVNPKKGQPVDLAFISLICIALDMQIHDTIPSMIAGSSK